MPDKVFWCFTANAHLVGTFTILPKLFVTRLQEWSSAKSSFLDMSTDYDSFGPTHCIQHTAVSMGELTLEVHFCQISFILMVCMWKYFIWQLACVKASRHAVPKTSLSHSSVYIQLQINQWSKRFVCVCIDVSITLAITSLCAPP